MVMTKESGINTTTKDSDEGAVLSISALTPVVGIGASAGELDAIGGLLSGLADDSGLAFVVIQHPDPDSHRALSELLSKRTSMRVVPVHRELEVAPNHIYVIQPGMQFEPINGWLHPVPRDNKPISSFLYAIAKTYGEQGIGIILSGHGDDGADGLKMLKAAGGLTLVQDPTEARHDGMPQSAIEHAHPDFVLRVEEMPYILMQYAKPFSLLRPNSVLMQESEQLLEKFVATVKSATGHDFGFYKPATLCRQITRRMTLHGLTNSTNYLALLQSDRAEADALLKDMVTNVTGFFRDPKVFETLAGQLASELLAHDWPQPFRVWVAGCSSGEEAYSLGMLLLEQMPASVRDPVLQIFASDIDEEALAMARFGAYPDVIRTAVSEERLKRFFVSENGRLRVSEPLRNIVTFSRHDVLRDPPFSRLKLVFCRNLMIHLTREARAQALTAFHFSLLDGGLLLLGASESTTDATELFEPVDDKLRLFRRLEHRHARPSQSGRSIAMKQSLVKRGKIRQPTCPPVALPERVNAIIVDAYAPACIVVNRELTPIYSIGSVGRYLLHASKQTEQNLSSLAREELRTELRQTIQRAFRGKHRTVRGHTVMLRLHDAIVCVTIEVRRLDADHDGLALVSFLEEPARHSAKPTSAASDDTQDSGHMWAKQQLTEAREELHQTIRELRDANETPSFRNEEIMSLNKEYLSSNEELESSKDKLQSLNEELISKNVKLQDVLEQQRRTALDLANLLSSASVATILLDADLNIKLFNPRMRKLFALIDSDVGRPLAELLPKFADPGLTLDVLAASTKGTTHESEIQAVSGAWYARAVTPYRAETGEIQGAVITFTDITRLKQAESTLAASYRYAELIINSAPGPMAVIDANLRIIMSNTAFRKEFLLTDLQKNPLTLDQFPRPLLAQPAFRECIKKILLPSAPVDRSDLELEEQTPEHHIWSVSLSRARQPASVDPIAVLTMEDITDQRQIIRKQLQLLIDALPVASCALDRQGRIRFVSTTMSILFGYTPQELLGKPIDMMVPPEHRKNHSVLQKAFLESPTRRAMATGLDIYGITKSGHKLPLDIGLSPIETADGDLVIVTMHDLREIRRAQAERDQLQIQLEVELADMRRLHELATRMAESNTLAEILEEILTSTMILQHADFGNIQLYDPGADTLSIAAQKNLPSSYLSYFARLDAGSCVVFRRALRTGTRVIIEDITQDADFGQYLEIATQTGFRALHSTPLLARDGEVKGLLTTYFSMPHVPTERELHLTDLCLRMATDLIEQVHAREALQKARMAAEHANTMKTKFLAAAGHDLRQPLQTIGLLKAVLERQIVNPLAAVTLAKLGDSTARMQDLVDSLLDTGLIETGAVQVELETLALGPILARVAGDFMSASAAKGLLLRCVPSSAFIRSDRRLLTRMLDNLLSNALKYTEKGKILLGCRRRGKTLRIEIWDTGIGVRHQGLESASSELNYKELESSGLGLGLYIAQRFAEQLDHKIEVCSKRDKGSVFSIIIKNPMYSEASKNGNKLKLEFDNEPYILITGDDPAQHDALNSLLQLEGYHPLIAYDSDEAASKLKEIQPNGPVVILANYDIFDKESGIDVAYQARATLQRQIPVLFLSNRELSPDDRQDMPANCQFLFKPTEATDLLIAIERAVQSQLPQWRSRSHHRLTLANPAPTSPTSEIAVIDDTESIRDAVREILEITGYKIECFSSAESYLADPMHERFKCLIIDIVLPGISGTELQTILNAQRERPQIIFLTGESDLPTAVKVLRDGAFDFLCKPVNARILLESVENALRHSRNPQIGHPRKTEIRERLTRLTKREREVLSRVIMGKLNKNIAADLGISERTTEHHRQNLMRKLEVKSLAMLIHLITTSESHEFFLTQ